MKGGKDAEERKKKKQRLEETNDEMHTTILDTVNGREIPDPWVRMNPQTPPNVPYHESSQYETEFYLN